MVAGSLRRRPYRVDFPERSELFERSRARIASGADTPLRRESCGHRPRRLVDAFMVVDQSDFLQRNRLLAIGRLRICLSLADRRAPCTASPAQAVADRRLDHFGGGREPIAQVLLDISRSRSLSTILRSFRSEARRPAPWSSWTEVCMPGIGDWEDPQLKNPQTPGAQVLRLDSPTERLGRGPGFQSGQCPAPARRTIRRSPLSGRRISITTPATIRLRRSTSSWPVSGIMVVTDWLYGKKPSRPALSEGRGRGQ